MVAGESILSCRNAIKPLVSAPYPAGGSGCGLWCLSPPVGECCPLVGVPPSAITACFKHSYAHLRVYNAIISTLKKRTVSKCDIFISHHWRIAWADTTANQVLASRKNQSGLYNNYIINQQLQQTLSVIRLIPNYDLHLSKEKKSENYL